MVNTQLHREAFGQAIIPTTLPKNKLEMLSESIRSKMIDSSWRADFGRVLVAALITEKEFAAIPVALYLVEEPLLCYSKLVDLLRGKYNPYDIDHALVAGLLNDTEAKSRIALMEVAVLGTLLNNPELREWILKIDQTRYDPVLTIFPMVVNNTSLAAINVRRLPINEGLLEDLPD